MIFVLRNGDPLPLKQGELCNFSTHHLVINQKFHRVIGKYKEKVVRVLEFHFEELTFNSARRDFEARERFQPHDTFQIREPKSVKGLDILT